MKFSILGTGSSGNCALLQSEKALMLVDAGFSARRTEQMLCAQGLSLGDVDAIFLTHEHGDHSAALTGLSKHSRIKVFTNHRTAHALQVGLKYRPDWHLFETGSRFSFHDIEVVSFSVPHDAQDPVGYVFTKPAGPTGATAKRFAWLTDLGHAPKHIHEHIRTANILAVESNHCLELLSADTKRPWSVKQRISGRHGHLSNSSTLALLEAAAGPTWQHIYLTHLSRDCNSRDTIDRVFSAASTKLPCGYTVVEPDMTVPFRTIE